MSNSSIDSFPKKDVLQSFIKLYQELRLDTLPLLPGSKKCNIPRWAEKDPETMWRCAPENANIGIRAGGISQVAILDFDDKNHAGTSDTGLGWLEGLGLKLGDYPLVKTASGVGHHVYVKFDGHLDGNYRHFAKDFGAGEFRFGAGSYVVAPPSVVQGSTYMSSIKTSWKKVAR